MGASIPPELFPDEAADEPEPHAVADPMANRRDKHRAALGRMGSSRAGGWGSRPAMVKKFVPDWAKDGSLLPKKPPGSG